MWAGQRGGFLMWGGAPHPPWLNFDMRAFPPHNSPLNQFVSGCPIYFIWPTPALRALPLRIPKMIGWGPRMSPSPSKGVSPL